MRTSKRVLALALALITMLMLAVPALAAEEQMYATTGLNVRKGPGSSYAKVGELVKGEVVTVTGRSGNWAYITYDGGAKGYASLSYLKAYTGSASTAQGTTMYINSPVNVRSGPGTNYSKVGELEKGEKVVRLGTSGAWSIIEWGTGTAYVSSGYLTSQKPSTDTGSSSGSIKMQALSGVNVRKGPGTGYAIAGTLDKGDIVYGTGVTAGNWTQITYKGETAYVSSAYLKKVSSTSSTPSGSGWTAYCTTNNTKVFDRASTASNVRGYLDKGQAVTVLDENGYWYAIQYGSRVCYVRSYYLTDEEYTVSTRTGVVYATSSVRVRTGPGSSYGSLGYLYSGESAERTGTTGSWTEIVYKGQTGYVPTSQVKAVTLSSMKSYKGYMYANTSKVYAYSIPTASATYQEGYYEKNEPVYVTAYNSAWAQVDQDGEILYVQKKYLNEEKTSGSGSNIIYTHWTDGLERVWVPDETEYYDSRYDYYDDEDPAGETRRGQYAWIMAEYKRMVRLYNEDREEIGWVHISDLDPDDRYWFYD